MSLTNRALGFCRTVTSAGRSPSSLSPIPEEPQERRRLSPTYEAGTPPPEGMGPDASMREGASIMVPSPEPDAEVRSH